MMIELRQIFTRCEMRNITLKAIKLTREELRLLRCESEIVSYLPATGDLYYRQVPLTSHDGTPWKH